MWSKRFVHEHTKRMFMQVEAEHDVSVLHQMYVKALIWASPGIAETLILHFDDREENMLSEIASNSLPSPVISWKDKSGSVGGDERMRSEVLAAPSYVSKGCINSRSRLCIYSSNVCTPEIVRHGCCILGMTAA